MVQTDPEELEEAQEEQEAEEALERIRCGGIYADTDGRPFSLGQTKLMHTSLKCVFSPRGMTEITRQQPR